MPRGCEMTNDFGVNTWVAFAGTNDNALEDSDFAVRVDELQPVSKSPRINGVNRVAIHSHMTEETPRILFLNYRLPALAHDLTRLWFHRRCLTLFPAQG